MTVIYGVHTLYMLLFFRPCKYDYYIYGVHTLYMFFFRPLLKEYGDLTIVWNFCVLY